MAAQSADEWIVDVEVRPLRLDYIW